MFKLIEQLCEQDIIRHFRISLDMFAYFLSLSNFQVAKSTQTNKYVMAMKESRNNAHVLLLHLEMYRPFNKPFNNSDKSYVAVAKIVNSLYCYCHTNGL